MSLFDRPAPDSDEQHQTVEPGEVVPGLEYPYAGSPAQDFEERHQQGRLPRLFDWLWPSPERRRRQLYERISALDMTIACYSQSPAGYLLRGELYLELQEYELAAADFERAAEYASAKLERAEWGLLAQVVQDRAQQGHEVAAKNLS